MRSLSFSWFLALALCFPLTMLDAAAQNVYVKFNAAYQFGLGSDSKSAGSGTIHDQGFTIKNERISINYGQGPVYTGTVGYQFTSNIGAEIGLSYLAGQKTEFESRFYYPEYYITETRHYQTNAEMVLIQPAIILTTENGKLKPYAKLGAVLALGTIYEEQHNALYSEKLDVKAEFSGGRGLGFMSAAGLTMEASPKLDFFLEFTMNNLTYRPAKWEITEAKENGQNVLYKYERSLTFTEEYYQNYNAKGEPQPTSQAHYVHLPMSSVGIGLGMKIRL